MGAVAEFRLTLRRKIVARMTRILTQPLHAYALRVPNNLPSLKDQLRVGDIILVEGDQRISQVIRYLTQSSWSHSALYIGDELRRCKPELAAALTAAHGDEARHVVIEATAEDGVTCAPVAKYARHNLRICRPRTLRREDAERIIGELIGQLGRRYNVRHIFDLGRYFFPVTLIPARFRRAALHHSGDTTRRVICSTMLARAFAHVGYPILPRVFIDDSAPPRSWMHRLTGRNGHGPRALYHEENPALITPRDFDLSPYFDVVKFNHLANGKFDYRRIEWMRRGEAPATPAAADSVSANGTPQRSRSSAA